MVKSEDFTVVVKDLPDFQDFGSLHELKALLWSHLEKVISAEPRVFDHEKIKKS
jgi:hypothetical protein